MTNVEAQPPAVRARGALLGPAFVAAIAYVDPGNVAANLTAGARYGYLLVWVLVVASAIALLDQYLSAKLGLAAGSTLPQLMGDSLHPVTRRLYWAQETGGAGHRPRRGCCSPT